LEERNMKAYLLTYNPAIWTWENIDDEIRMLQEKGSVETEWDCFTKSPEEGDIFFIVAVGLQSQKKGVFCSGIVKELQKNVSSLINHKKNTNRIIGSIDFLLNPNTDDILEMGYLQKHFPGQLWNPRSCGIAIKDKCVDELLDSWEGLIEKSKKYKNVSSTGVFYEGNPQHRLSTVYERSGSARSACIKKYGYKCAVCGMVMEEKYGEVGKDFIHIHHKDFISGYATGHEIDPITDLIPVCPNCHSMLHRKISGKYLNIDELKNILVQRGNHVR
jgi:5-methylcytosine-specific restriction protein A